MIKALRLVFALMFIAALTSQPLLAKKRLSYFTKQSFEVDFSITQAIEAGYVAGLQVEHQDKQIIVVGETDDHQRLVAVYQKKPSSMEQTYVDQSQAADYQLLRKISIDKQYLAFDFYQNKKQQIFLIALSAKGLSRFNLDTGLVEPMIDLESLYLNKSAQFLLRKHWVKDLNQDGRDDLIISGFSQVNILFQLSDGQFAPSSLPIAPFIDMDGSKVSYSDNRLLSFDMNHDELLEIAILENNQLLVYVQQPNNQFKQQPTIIDLPTKANSRAWWFVREADGSFPDQSRVKHKMLQTITDINGDNIVDLVIRQTQSHSVFDVNNQYHIYWGRQQGQKLYFENTIATSITAEGTLTGLVLKDLNNNGKQEVLVSSFELGVSQIIGALLSGSVDQNIYLYALDDKDHFSRKPVFSAEVDLHFSLSSGQSGQPVILSSDINGDKHLELLLSKSEKRLAIYSGLDTTKLVTKNYKKYSIQLPKDGSMLKAIDLNQDGKEAIIIRYGKQDDKKLRNKVVILHGRQSK